MVSSSSSKNSSGQGTVVGAGGISPCWSVGIVDGSVDAILKQDSVGKRLGRSIADQLFVRLGPDLLQAEHIGVVDCDRLCNEWPTLCLVGNEGPSQSHIERIHDDFFRLAA